MDTIDIMISSFDGWLQARYPSTEESRMEFRGQNISIDVPTAFGGWFGEPRVGQN
jgi:hypothetical protein